MKRIIFIFLFAVVFGVIQIAQAASNPTLTFIAITRLGCNNFAIGFNMKWSLNGSPAASYHYHTTEDAGGLRYMNQDFVQSGGFPDGTTLHWGLFADTSGGPTTGTYPIPKNTQINVVVDIFDAADVTQIGHFALTIPNCNGAVNACAELPTDAVVGEFTSDAILEWAPGKGTEPHSVIPAGQTAWVLGTDETGAYYEIWWSCSDYWVPVGTMGPNPDLVWQNHSLPTSNAATTTTTDTTTAGDGN